MNIINPATETVITTLESSTTEQLQQQYEELEKGQKVWASVSIDERIEIIKKFSELLTQNRDELAAILTSEMGKPIQESRGEIIGACGRIKYFVAETKKWLESSEVHYDGTTKEYLGFDPLGVLCSISAWNYPYLVGVNVHIPALLGGNAVMYKPSEYSSLTGLKMAELYHAAGVPKNVFATAIGEGDVGKELLKMPFNGFYFTGSYKTGKSIATAVADNLVPVGLELGGKDPMYVTDDVADIQTTAATAVEGSFYNNGQSCCAVERIYIHEKIYAEFCQAFAEEAQNLKVGDPIDNETTQGPLARGVHIDFLQKQVADAIQKGAELLTGGKAKEGKGYFFEPTVLKDCSHEMSIMIDESFGPIIGLQKVSGDEEAQKLMDETEYGLTASVFTSNQARGEKILAGLEVGNGYINCCDRVSPYLPWAGQRHSGLGSTLSYLGILAFVRPKGLHVRM